MAQHACSSHEPESQFHSDYSEPRLLVLPPLAALRDPNSTLEPHDVFSRLSHHPPLLLDLDSPQQIFQQILSNRLNSTPSSPSSPKWSSPKRTLNNSYSRSLSLTGQQNSHPKSYYYHRRSLPSEIESNFSVIPTTDQDPVHNSNKGKELEKKSILVEDHKFNDFQYWRVDLPSVNLDIDWPGRGKNDCSSTGPVVEEEENNKENLIDSNNNSTSNSPDDTKCGNKFRIVWPHKTCTTTTTSSTKSPSASEQFHYYYLLPCATCINEDITTEDTIIKDYESGSNGVGQDNNNNYNDDSRDKDKDHDCTTTTKGKTRKRKNPLVFWASGKLFCGHPRLFFQMGNQQGKDKDGGAGSSNNKEETKSGKKSKGISTPSKFNLLRGGTKTSLINAAGSSTPSPFATTTTTTTTKGVKSRAPPPPPPGINVNKNKLINEGDVGDGGGRGEDEEKIGPQAISPVVPLEQQQREPHHLSLDSLIAAPEDEDPDNYDLGSCSIAESSDNGSLSLTLADTYRTAANGLTLSDSYYTACHGHHHHDDDDDTLKNNSDQLSIDSVELIMPTAESNGNELMMEDEAQVFSSAPTEITFNGQQRPLTTSFTLTRKRKVELSSVSSPLDDVTLQALGRKDSALSEQCLEWWNMERAGKSSKSGKAKSSRVKNNSRDDDDLNVLVTKSDLDTLEQSIKLMQQTPNGFVRTSGGFSVTSEECLKSLKSREESWSKIMVEDGTLQPRYIVNCCELKYTCPAGLFAHLRKIHKVGLASTKKTSCKVCGELVSVDCQMLHIELIHNECPPGEQKLLFKTMEIEGVLESVMLLDQIPVITLDA